MAELKTKENDASVEAFLKSIPDEKKVADSRQVMKVMEEVTGEKPKMWGTSIIGFGRYHYKYASGREGDWMLCGLSPRKQSISVYLLGCGFEHFENLLQKLGKHKTGKGCLYVKKIEDINVSVLKTLIKESVVSLKKQYG
jgi:Domain of unknown function (DU1801)